jgi:hypothetical protein
MLNAKPTNAKTHCNGYNGRRKRGRPRKRWRDEVEEHNGNRKARFQWSETIGNGGRLYWKPRGITDCSAWEGEEDVLMGFIQLMAFWAVKIES